MFASVIVYIVEKWSQSIAQLTDGGLAEFISQYGEVASSVLFAGLLVWFMRADQARRTKREEVNEARALRREEAEKARVVAEAAERKEQRDAEEERSLRREAAEQKQRVAWLASVEARGERRDAIEQENHKKYVEALVASTTTQALMISKYEGHVRQMQEEHKFLQEGQQALQNGQKRIADVCKFSRRGIGETGT